MESLSIVDLFTRPGTYVLAGCVFLVTQFIRTVVQTIWPWFKKRAHENAPALTYATPMAMWWNKVILRAIPVLLGAASAGLPSSFFFGQLSLDARIMVGALVGGLAGYLVAVGKRLLEKKTGIAFATASRD